MNNDEKSALLAKIAQLSDVKHNPAKIVRIAKQADGKIVFLEEGNTQAGLQHIFNTIANFPK